MRTRGHCVLIAGLLVGASAGVAQETPQPEKHGAAAEQEQEPSMLWAWANFAILVGALGYLGVKKGGPYFAARSVSIRKGIAEAEEIHKDAEARAAEVDRRLAGLQTDIESLRTHAHQEQAAEAERIRQQMAAELARIQEHAGREIEAAGKAARLSLKRYAAELAVNLAEQKIRRQMTPEIQSSLVHNFSRDLERPSTDSHLNR